MNKKPRWYVTKVIPKEDYTLLLTFADGKKGIYDFKPNLHYPVYKKQKDIAFFMQAKAAYSSVVWPDDSDIDPEYLYNKCVDSEQKQQRGQAAEIED